VAFAPRSCWQHTPARENLAESFLQVVKAEHHTWCWLNSKLSHEYRQAATRYLAAALPGHADSFARAALYSGRVRNHLSTENWSEHNHAGPTSSFEASLRFATALVQDGISGVTIVVPRQPGVLARARAAAQSAEVSILAADVGSASITMRFSKRTPV
jgi:hypothetical protein